MMRQKIVGLGLSLVVSTSAWAAGAGYGTDDFETGHILSIGGGVASPSITSGLLGENPAGLAYNTQNKLLGELAGGNSDFNPMGSGGLFYLGNGRVGGGLGIQTFNSQFGNNNSATTTLFSYGIAAYIEGLNVSFGASGSYVFQNSGGGTTGNNNWGLDLGLIYNPKGQVRLGATASSVIDGVDAIGVGIAADANEFATFALDASSDTHFHGKTLKPAMGIHLMDFQLTVGYGVAVDKDAPNWIRRGGSFGIGFRLTPMFQLQGYYNQLAKYYGALTIRL